MSGVNDNLKVSSKGINFRQSKLQKEHFKKVLDTQESAFGVNRGIRVKDNTVYTYEQRRFGLSYFYSKRIVKSCGIHTMTLDI